MAVTMWAMNRFQRPGWVTGVCIACSFLCAIVAGAIEWWEVRRRKKLQKKGLVAPPLEVIRVQEKSPEIV
jgi:predicted outer membrane lipoprotein